MPEFILPEALDGRPWTVTQNRYGHQVSLDLKQHIGEAVPAATEGIGQARYHELARVKFAEDAPDLASEAGALAQSIEELRLDTLLEARGIGQERRLEDRDWKYPPPLYSEQDRVRFLLETVWQAQGESALTARWFEVFEQVKAEQPEIIETLKELGPALQHAIQDGGNGVFERDEYAARLQRLLSASAVTPPPPTGGPAPVVPQGLSAAAQGTVAASTAPPPLPPPSPPTKPPTKLEKVAPKKRQSADEKAAGEFGEQYQEVPLSPEEAKEAKREARAERKIAERLNEAAERGEGENSLEVYDPHKPKTHGGAAKIGHMLIHDHLGHNHRTHTIRKTSGARDRGVVPTQFHRYAIDKAIFSSRRAGGTVLIDGSGSMNWDPDVLEKVIAALPLATIAIYHGGPTDWQALTGIGINRVVQKARELYFTTNAGTPAKEREAIKERYLALEKELRIEVEARGLRYGAGGVRDHNINGTLCILGRDGRWGPMEHGRGGGNDVDVEALQWLAAQSGPRIWISDGGVCGGFYETLLGDDGLQRVCDTLCQKHRITRVEDVRGALKALRINVPELERLKI